MIQRIYQDYRMPLRVHDLPMLPMVDNDYILQQIRQLSQYKPVSYVQCPHCNLELQHLDVFVEQRRHYKVEYGYDPGKEAYLPIYGSGIDPTCDDLTDPRYHHQYPHETQRSVDLETVVVYCPHCFKQLGWPAEWGTKPSAEQPFPTVPVPVSFLVEMEL